jgi:hypothetical protein
VVLGGTGQAAGEDAWAAAKTKLSGWARLGERQQRKAFAQALEGAVAELRRISADTARTERALQLLTNDRPEGRAFLAVVVDEFLFSVEPDVGRVLDEYRRNLRFAGLLRREEPPPWAEVQPVLVLLIRRLLPSEMLKHNELRQIVLDQAELRALADARITAHSTTESAATLGRIESLLRELTELPRIQALTRDSCHQPH